MQLLAPPLTGYETMRQFVFVVLNKTHKIKNIFPKTFSQNIEQYLKLYAAGESTTFPKGHDLGMIVLHVNQIFFVIFPPLVQKCVRAIWNAFFRQATLHIDVWLEVFAKRVDNRCWMTRNVCLFYKSYIEIVHEQFFWHSTVQDFSVYYFPATWTHLRSGV